MVPQQYRLFTLPTDPTGCEVARFVEGIEEVRRAALVAGLKVHSLSATGDSAAGEVPMGQVTVELRGHLKQGVFWRPERFIVWAKFEHWRRGSDGEVVISFRELYAGLVTDREVEELPPANNNEYWGSVYDISTGTLALSDERRGIGIHPPTPTYIPGFPQEWRELVQAQVAAAAFAWLLHNPSA